MNFLINSALTLASNQLKYFSRLNNFWQVFDTAFGTQYNRSLAEILRLQWEAGDFSQLPQIEILDSSILGGANGAYASSKNKIYLSNTFVAGASLAAISGVLLEEIGHFVDAKINQTDSAGDEGAIFAALVQGQNLDVEILRVLKAEDDHSIITLNGQKIQVENALDTNKPYAVSLTPKNGGKNVALNTNLVMEFNEAIKKGTGNIKIIKLSNNQNNQTVEVISVNNVTISGREVIIDPTNDFEPETNYYLTVDSTAILDLAGNNYVGFNNSIPWNFTTDERPVAEILTPRYIPDVAVDTNLIMNFNENVKKGTGYIRIFRKSNNTQVEDTQVEEILVTSNSVTISGTQVTIDPVKNLEPGVTYYVKIASTAILDLAGINYGGFENPNDWYFTTDGASKPYALSLTPNNGDKNVALNTNLVMEFSEAIKKGTGNIKIIKLSNNQTVEVISVNNVTISGNQVIINPTNDFEPGTKYYLTVDSTAILDLAGDSTAINYPGFENPNDWYFTTDETLATIQLPFPIKLFTKLSQSGLLNAQIVGNYAYVASGRGLEIIDISDPTNPIVKGRWNYNISSGPVTSGYVYAVQVIGNYAYAASGRGLEIIDISNPTAPTLKGNYNTSGTTWNVQIVGNYAYAASNRGLEIIDISDPSNPKSKGSYPPDYVNDVQVVGNYAYAASSRGLEIIDISDPTNPIVKGRWNYNISSGLVISGYVYAVQVIGNYAYAASSRGLEIIDISNPSNPTLQASYAINDGSYPEVGVVGNYAYVNNGKRLEIIDISNPSNPTLKGYYNSGNMQVVGNYAYVAGTFGLQIIDITDITKAIPKGNYDTGNYAQSVQVVDNYAYVSASDAGLQIIDITDPTKPILKGNYDTPGYAHNVQLLGNYAYVADGLSGLQIIDIRNATTPILKGNYNTLGYAHDVQVVDNYAYVADGLSGLQIIDISDPSVPTLKENYNTPGDANDVQVVGNYAYVADGLSGLQIIDISDPTKPILKGNYKSTYQTYAVNVQVVEVVGNYAYLLYNGSGIEIIDISDPTKPTLKSKDDVSYGYDVQIIGNYAYVYVADDKIKVYDVGDFTDTNQAPTNITLNNSTIAENQPINTKIGNFTTTDPNTGDTFTYSLVSGAGDTNNNSFIIVGNNELQTKAIFDYETKSSYSIRVKTTDQGGLSFEKQLTIGVTDINETVANLSISPSNVTQTEGNSGNKPFTFTVTRTGNTTGTNSVNWKVTSSGTNFADANDFGGTLPSGTLTFAPNKLTETITINVSGDTSIEPNETFTVTLSSPTNGATITTASATGTITNDETNQADKKPPEARNLTPINEATNVSANANLVLKFDEAIKKGTGNIFIKKALDDSIVETIVVTSNNVTISPDKLTLTINPTDDLASGTEYYVQISDTAVQDLAGNYYAGFKDSKTTWKFTTNSVINLEITSPSSFNEDDNTKKLLYTFTRTGTTAKSLTVSYDIGGTATFIPKSPENDYTQTGAGIFTGKIGTIVFAANESKATLTIDPLKDTLIEKDETVVLTLLTGTGYTVGTNKTAIGTIKNDDELPKISLPFNITLVEGKQEVKDGKIVLNGTITIGRKNLSMIKVIGSVTYDEKTITINGQVTSLIGDNSVKNKSLFKSKGTFDIDVKTGTGTLTEDNSFKDQYQLAGLDVDFTSLTINMNGLALGAKFKLIEDLGLPDFVFSGSDGLLITQNNIKLGSSIKFSAPNFSNFQLFKFLPVKEFSSISIEYVAPEDKIKIQGKLVIGSVGKIGEITADFVGDTGDNYIQIQGGKGDFKGSLSVNNIELQNGWGISEATLKLDTVNKDVSGKAKVTFPFGASVPPKQVGAGLELGFKLPIPPLELNLIGAEVDGLNVPIGNTGAFLQGLSGKIENFAPSDPDPVEFSGGLKLTGGPKIAVDLTAIGVGKFEAALVDLEASVSVNKERIKGDGKFKIIHEKVANSVNLQAEINWNKGFFETKGRFSLIDDLIKAQGGFKASSKFDITMSGQASVNIPNNVPLVGGAQVASGNFLFNFTNNGNLSDDFAAGWTTINIQKLGLDWSFVGGFKVFFDGKKEFIGAKNLPKTSSFTIAPGTDWILMGADWEKDNDNVKVKVKAPDGTIFNESDFAATGKIAIVNELTNSTTRVVIVRNPEPGIWDINAVDDTGLGQVTYSAFRDSIAPTIEITSPLTEVTDQNVIISYNAFDSDSNAKVSLFYDDNNQDFDGILIKGDLDETDGAGSFTWNTKDISEKESNYGITR